MSYRAQLVVEVVVEVAVVVVVMEGDLVLKAYPLGMSSLEYHSGILLSR